MLAQIWKASCQGRPPNALGDLDDLDGDVDGDLGVAEKEELRQLTCRPLIGNAHELAQAAAQATWPPDHLTLHLVHLAHLSQVDCQFVIRPKPLQDNDL